MEVTAPVAAKTTQQPRTKHEITISLGDRNHRCEFSWVSACSRGRTLSSLINPKLKLQRYPVRHGSVRVYDGIGYTKPSFEEMNNEQTQYSPKFSIKSLWHRSASDNHGFSQLSFAEMNTIFSPQISNVLTMGKVFPWS